MVDGSSSVKYYGENNFQMMKDFMKNLTRSFNVSSGETRVGVIVYSTNSTVAFKLDQFTTTEKVEEAIENIVYPGGGTYTGKALNLAGNDLFNDAVVRSNVPKVLVLVTDGVSTDDVTQPAALLRGKGVIGLVVAIGQNIDHSQLTQIAHGKPEQVYKAEFMSLGIVTNDIRGAICRGNANKDRILQTDLDFFLYLSSFSVFLKYFQTPVVIRCKAHMKVKNGGTLLSC